jgi:hypothetical protein
LFGSGFFLCEPNIGKAQQALTIFLFATDIIWQCSLILATQPSLSSDGFIEIQPLFFSKHKLLFCPEKNPHILLRILA